MSQTLAFGSPGDQEMLNGHLGTLVAANPAEMRPERLSGRGEANHSSDHCVHLNHYLVF